jgi:type VI secretion system protein ImpK
MKLMELCSPFFEYVSSLKRSLRRKADLGVDAVRAEVKKHLESMKNLAATDADLEDQYDRVKMPLIFFVDFVVLESRSFIARDWVPIAEEYNELAGDQKFFEMLEGTLEDESDKAAERLVVYHLCLGLGFTGAQDDEAVGGEGGRAYLSFVGAGSGTLDKLKRRTYNRVRKILNIKAVEHLCPSAYDGVNRENHIEDTGRTLAALAISLIGLVFVLIIANFFLFSWTSRSITTVLDSIEHRAGAPVLKSPDAADRPDPSS